MNRIQKGMKYDKSDITQKMIMYMLLLIYFIASIPAAIPLTKLHKVS